VEELPRVLGWTPCPPEAVRSDMCGLDPDGSQSDLSPWSWSRTAGEAGAAALVRARRSGEARRRSRCSIEDAGNLASAFFTGPCSPAGRGTPNAD
jgi:hypothetical protein